MVCEPAEPLTIISAVSTCHQDQTPGHTEQEDSDPEVWQDVMATKTACASSEIIDGGVTEWSRVHTAAFVCRKAEQALP